MGKGRPPGRGQLALVALVVLAVAVPVLLTGFAALSTVWRPSGDWAVLELDDCVGRRYGYLPVADDGEVDRPPAGPLMTVREL